MLTAKRRALRAFLRTRRIGTDACGIPSRPTWSLRELLSSYPSPTLSPTTFQHLHELSALIPPAQGTPEYDLIKNELDELVRLVDAVRLVDVGESVPDERVWTGVPPPKVPLAEEMQGTKLLRYASRTMEGMYVVETDRERWCVFKTSATWDSQSQIPDVKGQVTSRITK